MEECNHYLVFAQSRTVQCSFLLPRRQQNHMKIVSCRRANQLQKMPYVVPACSWIPPATLCCCPNTAKDGNSEPLRVDGYIRVSQCLSAFVCPPLFFFKVCSMTGRGYVLTLATELKKKSKNLFPCLFTYWNK